MNKGRRYDEPKLNMKKVFGVFFVFVLIIILIVSMVSTLKKGKTTPEIANKYFVAYNNQKWGIINSKGETVIDFTYDEMIAIPNNTKPIFICTYEVNDSDGTYKSKAINEKNEQIFTEYEKVEAIDNYDSKQNIWYEDNVLRVLNNGKYGLIDFEGNVLLKCEYDSIYSLKGVKENFIVEKDSKIGLVNAKGQDIIKTEFYGISLLEEGYKNEYIIKDEQGNLGVISTSGKILIEPKYKDIKYLSSSEIYAVNENDKWVLAKTDGTIIDLEYENYFSIKGENVIVSKDNKYGIVNINGEVVIEPEYDSLKYMNSVYYIASKDEKYGIININNEEILPFEYISITYIKEGDFTIAESSISSSDILDSNLAKKTTGIVSEININKNYIKIYSDGEYKYYNFRLEEKKASDLNTNCTLFLSKKDEKYGYVNSNGNLIVNYIYDDATEQNSCGYVAVKKDGVWGSLGQNGNIVLEPSVNLDNSIFIDFIGKWHLSSDGLYYTK